MAEVKTKIIDGVIYSNDFEPVKEFLKDNPDKKLWVFQNIDEIEPGFIVSTNAYKLKLLHWSDDLFKRNFFYRLREFEDLKIQADLENSKEPEEIPELDVIRIAVKNKLTRLIYPGKYVLDVAKIDSSYSKDCYHVLKDNREVKMAWGFIQKNMFPDFSNSPIYIVKGVSGVYDAFQEFKEGDYLVRKTLLSEPKYVYGYIVSSEKVEG